MSEENYDKTFQVVEPSRLEVRNIRGSMKILPGTKGSINVKAVMHKGTGDAERTKITITQEPDGTVKAFTSYPDHSFGCLFNLQPCKVDFEVTAPPSCVLSVKGVTSNAFVDGFEGGSTFDMVSGDLYLYNLCGNLKVKTISGNAELADLSGDLLFKSVSGDIHGKRLAGPMQLDVVSGDVRLYDSKLSSVHATSVSGDLELETPLAEGPYRFNSVSGDVGLKVPQETSCSAELHSMSGELSVRLPQAFETRRYNSHAVEIQGGGAQVFLKSVSGDLSIGR